MICFDIPKKNKKMFDYCLYKQYFGPVQHNKMVHKVSGNLHIKSQKTTYFAPLLRHSQLSTFSVDKSVDSSRIE